MKISLKKYQKPVEKPRPKNILKKTPVLQKETTLPKGSQLKEIPKKKITFKKPIKKITPKLNEKPKKKIEKKEPIKKKDPLSFIKTHKPIQKTEKTYKEKKKMDWLYEDKSDLEREKKKAFNPTGLSAGKDIKELYGNDFNKLTKGQQEYIIDNNEIMRRITQAVLNRQASVSTIYKLRVNRSNIIEFYLHPNGDMSDFKFLQKSGYFALDDVTKATIEFAYSKYPLPKEKVLIRYNVFYNLR